MVGWWGQNITLGNEYVIYLFDCALKAHITFVSHVIIFYFLHQVWSFSSKLDVGTQSFDIATVSLSHTHSLTLIFPLYFIAISSMCVRLPYRKGQLSVVRYRKAIQTFIEMDLEGKEKAIEIVEFIIAHNPS